MVVMAPLTPRLRSVTTALGCAMHSYTRDGMSCRKRQLQHSTSILAMGRASCSGSCAGTRNGGVEWPEPGPEPPAAVEDNKGAWGSGSGALDAVTAGAGEDVDVRRMGRVAVTAGLDVAGFGSERDDALLAWDDGAVGAVRRASARYAALGELRPEDSVPVGTVRGDLVLARASRSSCAG